MTKYSFDINNSKQKLICLLTEYKEYLQDSTSSTKANSLCSNSWHLTDWVFEEFKDIHGKTDLGEFRNSLYPRCRELKIIHVITNGSKHFVLSRPKSTIKTTRKCSGAFSSGYSRAFNIQKLQIEFDDGTIVDFSDIIKDTIRFWEEYFSIELGIEI